MEYLNVILGYRCNYTCSHCGNNSGPANTSSDLSNEEISQIKQLIATRPPRMILYSGGETTLYIDQINSITEAHPAPEKLNVTVVTNGWFGSSEEKVADTLGRLRKLSAVDFSYDKFHGSKTRFEYIGRVARYCRSQAIDFKVTMSLSTPLELLDAKRIRDELDIPIQYQRVINSGRAKVNKAGFQYFSFDRAVLDRKCPAKGMISFLPGKGFSTCCSSVIFNRTIPGTFHRDLDQHLQSEFFRDLQDKTLGQIAEDRGLKVSDLTPEHSLECNLCELIHSNG